LSNVPPALPRSGIKPLGSAKVRRLTTTSENESTIDGYAALQAEMVDRSDERPAAQIERKVGKSRSEGQRLYKQINA